MKLKQEIPSTAEKIIGYKCDNCGKEILTTELPLDMRPCWYPGSTISLPGEKSWGEYDVKYWEVCSADCYVAQLEKWANFAQSSDGDRTEIAIPTEMIRILIDSIPLIESDNNESKDIS